MINRGLLLILFLGISAATFAQNLDFEQGLAGWHVAGKVSIAKTDQHKGSACAKIESGSIYKTIAVNQLAVVQFDAYVKSTQKGIKAYSFVRFYNAKHQQLLEFKSKAPDSASYQQTGNYVESPALSSYMEIGIEKAPGSSGAIYADDFTIEPNMGSPTIKHPPLVDLDQYMKPFWRSDTIYNETVLLYSKNGSRAAGELLYQPDHILSVTSFDLKNTYNEGKDYLRSGNVIVRAVNSSMPFRADTSFDKKDLAWFNTESQWIVVTYTHHDAWNGPVPAYKGGQMSRTIAKLRAKKPLTIVAYGMSITRGMDVSGYDTIPPYMPSYVDLFARQLDKSYHDPNVKLFNAGLPGSRVDWGAQYADKYINPLKPDLVILDFGMNDFWHFTPDQFKVYIETMMHKISATNPNVEFILLSNMKFDPDYVLDSDQYKSFYTGNLEGYSRVLKLLEAKGIINLDMFAISGFIYDHKKAKDCIANPLHPNDYLARWYAQALSALLVK